MESIVGRGSGLAFADVDKQPQRRPTATARLLCDMQRESAEQTLFTLAALEYYEQELLRVLQQRYPHDACAENDRLVEPVHQHPPNPC